MSDAAIDLNGPDPAEESDSPAELDNGQDSDDNSIRALLARGLAESTDSPLTDKPGADDDTESEPDAAIADDDEPKPPQSWTAAEREAWQDMPEAARAAVQRREKDYQAGLRTDAELQKVLQPVTEQLQGTGVHVDQYIANVLQGDAYIQQQPLQAALAILEQHDLLDQAAELLQQHRTGPEQGQRTQPTGQAGEVAELRRQMEYQNAVYSAQREWDAFTREHPDALELREVIAAKIGANPRMTYAEAHEAAISLVKAANGSIAKATERAAVERGTRAAGKAGRLNLPRGRSDTPAPATSSGSSLREDLEAAMRSLR